MHQWLIEPEQGLLLDDIRVISHYRWLAQAGSEMHQVHIRPGKVVVDQICLFRQLGEIPERR
ncbi:hypothetical protein D3C81_1960290 [compost metagenome]